jgi:hypothetical protein
LWLNVSFAVCESMEVHCNLSSGNKFVGNQTLSLNHLSNSLWLYLSPFPFTMLKRDKIETISRPFHSTNQPTLIELLNAAQVPPGM